jgi:uncharacterized surface protein with fasciclin (FAS1) repeats
MKIYFSALLALALVVPTQGAESKQKSDILETAGAAGSFQTLAAALKAAELIETLQGAGPFTVLAPTDEAFAKLPKATLQDLLKPENRERLSAILTYHVIPGQVQAKDALIAQKAATVQGSEVAFQLDAGQLRVNHARVLTNDLACSNGIIHVIDTVLLPPESPKPQGRKVIGIYPGSPSRAQRKLLGLQGNEGYLVKNIVRDSGAEQAGLEGHDVILAINGQRATRGSLDAAKEQVDVGDFIEVVVARTIKVRVGLKH